MCICTIKAANLPNHAAQEECGAGIPHCEVGAPKSSMPPICYMILSQNGSPVTVLSIGENLDNVWCLHARPEVSYIYTEARFNTRPARRR